MPSFHPGLSETEPALSADALSGRSAFFLALASISWPRMDFSRRSTTRLKCDDPLCQLVDGERGGDVLMPHVSSLLSCCRSLPHRVTNTPTLDETCEFVHVPCPFGSRLVTKMGERNNCRQ